MKRDEFYLGALVYALIIGAGFYGPLREKFENIPWDKPIYSLLRDHFRPTSAVPVDRAKKAILALKVRRVLAPDRAVSISAMTQDSIRQNLAENWKKMAAHPEGLGQETESSSDVPPLLGIKTGTKTKPVLPEKKSSSVEEPMKG